MIDPSELLRAVLPLSVSTVGATSDTLVDITSSIEPLELSQSIMFQCPVIHDDLTVD